MIQEADSIIMVFSIERRLGDHYLNPKASAVQVHVVVYPTDVKCIRTAWFSYWCPLLQRLRSCCPHPLALIRGNRKY